MVSYLITPNSLGLTESPTLCGLRSGDIGRTGRISPDPTLVDTSSVKRPSPSDLILD